MVQALLHPEFSSTERACGDVCVCALWTAAYALLGLFLVWVAAEPLT